MPNDPNRQIAKDLLELQRTLGWMDLVIGSITDAVYVVDAQSRLVFVNQFFADLLGVHRVFLLGQHLDDVFPTAMIDISGDDFAASTNVSLDDKGENIGVYLWRKNNHEYIFKISRKQLVTTDQTVYFAQNITKEHELFRLKNTFINLASHQLRTPMTAIMTYAHMLHDGYAGELDSNQKNLTEKVLDASERMIKLINDILYITRVQNEQTELMPQNVPIESVITMIENEIDVRIADKKIDFQTSVPDDLPPIICAQPIVYEVLSNIIVNAVQYTPNGGKITVAVKHVKDQFVITVSDTGIGIPKDYLPHIFDQFSRADNALEVFNEGTGLGLYLVRILVARINGKIECVSTLHKGTTFTLTLPEKLA